MATLNDVAERAGVSVTTISRMLNNRVPVSQETRDAIIKAMEELTGPVLGITLVLMAVFLPAASAQDRVRRNGSRLSWIPVEVRYDTSRAGSV